jgi:hypothetical protein
LRHGLQWCDPPLELGYGSGITCWRRLRRWQALGVWAMLHQVIVNWLGVEEIDHEPGMVWPILNQRTALPNLLDLVDTSQKRRGR